LSGRIFCGEPVPTSPENALTAGSRTRRPLLAIPASYGID